MNIIRSLGARVAREIRVRWQRYSRANGSPQCSLARNSAIIEISAPNANYNYHLGSHCVGTGLPGIKIRPAKNWPLTWMNMTNVAKLTSVQRVGRDSLDKLTEKITRWDSMAKKISSESHASNVQFHSAVHPPSISLKVSYSIVNKPMVNSSVNLLEKSIRLIVMQMVQRVYSNCITE